MIHNYNRTNHLQATVLSIDTSKFTLNPKQKPPPFSTTQHAAWSSTCKLCFLWLTFNILHLYITPEFTLHTSRGNYPIFIPVAKNSPPQSIPFHRNPFCRVSSGRKKTQLRTRRADRSRWQNAAYNRIRHQSRMARVPRADTLMRHSWRNAGE